MDLLDQFLLFLISLTANFFSALAGGGAGCKALRLPMESMPPRLALLACSVFEREIEMYAKDAPQIVVTSWFEMGLHDQPDNLRSTLQAAIDELDGRDDIDAIAAKGDGAGCLAMPPTMMPPPIGYITMLRDPDGNMVEFSWDQGVYATLAEKWGR